MEKKYKEIGVDIEGFSVESLYDYNALCEMLDKSQGLAVQNFGRLAVAVWEIPRET